jgi:hypothetical protein
MSLAQAERARDTSTPVREASTGADVKRFHILMLLICGFLFLVALIGDWRTGVWDFDTLPAALLLIPISLLPALFWHRQRHRALRDASLALFWAVTLLLVSTLVTPLTVRLRLPMRDGLLARLDASLGISVKAIVESSSSHQTIRNVLAHAYELLPPFLLLAILIPALTGRKRISHRFVLQNGIASVVALPFTLAVPAIGPWVGDRFPPSPLQSAGEKAILALRANIHMNASFPGGPVACPSFHVIWAILAAYALSSMMPRLGPVIWMFAAAIVISTMTTGWHYGVDAVAGVVLASAAIALSDRAIRTVDSSGSSPTLVDFPAAQ